MGLLYGFNGTIMDNSYHCKGAPHYNVMHLSEYMYNIIGEDNI